MRIKDPAVVTPVRSSNADQAAHDWRDDAGRPWEPMRPATPLAVRLLNFAEFKAERKAPAGYVIDGYVRTGSLYSVNSRPNLGKTALLVDISRRTSRGEEWMGRTTTRCSVVYIAAEDAEDVRNRLEAVDADEVRIMVSDDPFVLTKPEAASDGPAGDCLGPPTGAVPARHGRGGHAASRARRRVRHG